MEERPKRRNTRHNPNKQTCNVDGCTELSIGWFYVCQDHYFKQKKPGISLERMPGYTEPRGRTVMATGYVMVSGKGHPLKMKNGLVYEHRKVAYDKYGEGPLACHWCAKEMTWKTAEVDHLDWERGNNQADNLVVSCGPCNLKRKSPKEVAEAEAPKPLMKLAMRMRQND